MLVEYEINVKFFKNSLFSASFTLDIRMKKVYVFNQIIKEVQPNGSILCEMSHQERNERPEIHNDEERQTSNPGNLPIMRD